MSKRGWVPTMSFRNLVNNVFRHTHHDSVDASLHVLRRNGTSEEMPPSVAGAERGEVDSFAQPPAHRGAYPVPLPS